MTDITPRKTSTEYWGKRIESIHEDIYKLTVEQEKDLARIYQESSKEIQAKIDAFYQRWADEQGLVSKEEAKKDLSREEFTTWKKSIKEYHNDTKSIQNETERKKAQRQIDGLALRSRITRELSLQSHIELELMRMKVREEKSILGHLISMIQYGYNKMMYEISKGIGYLVSFATLPLRAVNFILGYKWKGANWSERLWGNRDVLASQVKDVLGKGFTQGKSVRNMSRDLAERMDVGSYVSRRLIQTESNFVSNQSTAKSFEDSGFIEQYMFLATLDSKTSKPCKHLDKKVYALSERKVGTNYPPLHPYCRSTVLSIIPDSIPSMRIARDKNGKNIYVPFDISYEEYQKEYLKETK